MKTKKAIPTEYRGVRFRSKSEAMLARCFDIAGIFWNYEPPNNTYHKWDFFTSGPRLRRVVKFVECQWDMPASPIKEMHDHEGNLCVVLVSNIGCYLASVICDAWDDAGECGDCNVEFITP